LPAETLPMATAPEKSLSAAERTELHRAGSAWTDKGTQRLVEGGSGSWSEAVNCHLRAVEILGRLPVDEDPAFCADLATAWVNLGCALLAGTKTDSPEGAVAAFGRAIALLERLPVETTPRFRHNLAAAWMNRGDALGRVATAGRQDAARSAYARAIGIASLLPLDEKPSFRILLASSGINLGNLLQRSGRYDEAVAAFDGAIAALGGLAGAGHRLACHHAATAWTNRGDALLEGSRADEAVESAMTALRQFGGHSLDGPADAKVSLRALRVAARGLESRLREGRGGVDADVLARITDIAERGFSMAAAHRAGAPDIFDPFIVWFFSFGSRIYGLYQPRFLEEYLSEGLARWDRRSEPVVAAQLRIVARQAVDTALERLSSGRVIVAGTRETERLLGTIDDLRGAAVRLTS
jgi:tetratricopeptide (TPR) repeat protein